jgi:hypothetical protein
MEGIKKSNIFVKLLGTLKSHMHHGLFILPKFMLVCELSNVNHVDLKIIYFLEKLS